MDGNILKRGSDLVIRIEGATIVTAKLYKKQSFFRWKLIQIEQSGRLGNPERDTVKLELKEYNNFGQLVPMDRGKYKVETWAYIPSTSSYGNKWTDKFEVV